MSVTSVFAAGPELSADYTTDYYDHLWIRLTCSAANGIRGLSGGCLPLGMLMDDGSKAERSSDPYRRYGTN